MSENVRVASVGLGWWGGVLADAGRRAGLEIAACFARTAAARDEFAARHGARPATDLDEILTDDRIDGVLLATPHSTHEQLAIQAAQAGKHVFVEKPLTLDVAAAMRVVHAAEQAGVVLQVGHMRRRVPAFRKLITAVDTGRLGMPQLAEAQLSYPKGLTPRTGWRADPAESPAGGMTGLGVHLADNLIRLLGAPARVTAMSKRVVAVGPLDDVTAAVIEFERGPLATLTTSMVVPDVARTAVAGTEASAWIEQDGGVFAFQRVGDKDPQLERFDVTAFDPVEDELREFARCIRTGSRPETGGREALPVVAILEGIVRSAAGEGVVDVARLLADAERRA